MILVSFTLNQVARSMQSLFTNCSHQNGESWKWRHYHTNWLSICSFDQITSLLFPPFQSCFIYHVLLFVDDVVISWPQTKISDWSEIKCIVILAVHNRTCSTQSVYHATSKSCMIQSNSTVTLYFLVYDTSIMILHGVYS